MSRPDPLFVQSLAKGFELLEAFSQRPSTMSMNELMEITGFDRSTTQRMTHTLVTLGYLERGAGGKGYTPGKKILQRSFDYMRSVPLLERATPLIAEMQRETSERVELSLFDDLYIIFALRRQTKRQTFSSTLAGRELPMVQTAGGRAIMSHLPDEEVEDLLTRSQSMPRGATPSTPKTNNDPDRIRGLVVQARQDGYAMAIEESLLGELNLASAILDHRHRPVAAIQIAGLMSEWASPEEFARRYSPLLMTAARALSGKVGMS